ncbi:IclR family transcriptional regulator [Desulfosarcina ovata]|uniref:IclR family transcriptional regulator n=1 Tax=Desulfosarcina ovata TaxID=83564 RepID=UPI001391050D|nr:IclR family transcriptional regulator C-terminal domain-containing protein [Desulfosarcina ovata]
MGPRLFVLGSAAAGGAELIKTVHPYLEAINSQFKFSTFLGILANEEVIIVDKADRAHLVKISSEIGMRRPVFAGVSGKALLAQLPVKKIEKIIENITPVQYTPRTITDKIAFRDEILKVKQDGIAYDMEEYIEGMIAVAVPLQAYREDLQAVIWTVGLKHDFTKPVMAEISSALSAVADEINSRFSLIAGHFE